jgi:hypothetical protein
VNGGLGKLPGGEAKLMRALAGAGVQRWSSELGAAEQDGQRLRV